MLESELHGVFAVNPLKVFLQNVVVFHVLEGACVGAAPLHGRVRTGEARFGEGGVRFSRGQSLESRLDGPLAVNGCIGDRDGEPGNTEACLIQQRRGDGPVFAGARHGWNLLHNAGLRIRQRHRRVGGAFTIRPALAPLSVRPHEVEAMAGGEIHVHLAQVVVHVITNGQISDVVVLKIAVGGRGQRRLKIV